MSLGDTNTRTRHTSGRDWGFKETTTGLGWRFREAQRTMFGDGSLDGPERWMLADGEGGVPLPCLGLVPAALEREGAGRLLREVVHEPVRWIRAQVGGQGSAQGGDDTRHPCGCECEDGCLDVRESSCVG